MTSQTALIVVLTLLPSSGAFYSEAAQEPANAQRDIALLASGDAGERAMAASRLGKLGSKAVPAIPTLVRLLGDDAQLIDWAGQGRSTVSKVVFGALRELGEPARTELLRVADLDTATMNSSRAGTEVATVIAGAIDALGDLPEPRAVALLTKILLQSEPVGDDYTKTMWVNKPLHAAEAIAKIQGASAFETLEESFRLKRSRVAYLLTWRLAEKLAATGGIRAVGPLVEWLTQAQAQPEARDPTEVEKVIEVLGQLKDQRTVDGLFAALEGGRLASLKAGPNVYDMTRPLLDSINKLTGQSFKDRTSALQWRKSR